MATSLKELIVTYEANAKPVLDALNQVDAKIKATSKSLLTVGDSFRKAGFELSASLTAPLGLLSVKALQASADFEALKMQMEVLTGSAAEGERVFNRLVKFAAETPFELNQLAKATNTLMGFGETADEAYDHLKLIGDIAAVSGGDFNGITVAFGQVSAAGRLMGQDLLQLVNNGVPAIKMLADEMGVPKERIKDLVSEGKVTFPILVRAFERATSKGGMFEGGMEKLSRTSRGVWSTFKDNVNIALAKFGDEMQKSFNLTSKLEKFGQWIGRLAENFSKLYPETKKNIFIILGLAAVIGPLLILLGTLIRLVGLAAIGFSALLTPFRFIISLFPAIIAGFRALTLLMMANPLAAFVTASLLILTYWKEIVEIFKKAGAWIGKFLPSMGEIKENQSNADYSPTDYKPALKAAGSLVSNGIGSLNNFLAEKNLLPDSFLKGGSNNSPMAAGPGKVVNHNLTVNIPPGTSAADALSIKNSIRKALQEENRQSYIELGAQ
jgi:tape measure domain-containing protein